MAMNLDEAINLIAKEAERAIVAHKPFHSPHEGYAVIKEELDELWDAIKAAKSFNERNPEMEKEAIQVGAMAARFLVDLIWKGHKE